jgi:hypothetical protein
MKLISTSSGRRPVRFGVALGAAGLAGVLALSACASAGSAEPTGAASTPDAVAGAPLMAGGGGVSGEIAAISGSTLQVQDSESQTAVSYTDATTITQSVVAALADVSAGACVIAFTGGSVAPAATGDADASTAAPDAGTAAAASVTISDAVDGECAVGAFGGMGAPPEGLPDGAPDGSGAMVPPTDAPDGVMPTGVPDADMPTGSPGAGGFGGLSAGRVAAVSATGFTVQTTDADGTTSTSEVTVDDATTYTRIRSADASVLTVGACVTAMGEADDKGAVVATALAISAAGDDGCSAVVTTRGPGGGQRPAQSGSTGSGS